MKKDYKELAIRTLFGAIFLIVMVVGLQFSKYLFAALFTFIIFKMMMEFHRMNLGNEYPLSQVFSILTGLALFWLVFAHKAWGLDSRFISLAFVPLLAMMIDGLFIKDKSEFGKMGNLYASILYIALPFTFTTYLVFKGNSFHGDLMLCLFVIVWCSDIGAYIFGMGLGQKWGPKLCPSISPKKTWVGCIGGFIFSVAVALVMHSLDILPFPVWHCIILATLLDVFGVFGDLIESQWKRHCALKDSGHFLPGHGGMLDRFDSAVVALPVATIYLLLTGLI